MKRRWKKIAAGFLAVVGLLLATLFGYVELRWNRHYDDVVGPDLHVSRDPRVIAHGEYLVRGPAHCASCHMSSFAETTRMDRGELVLLSGGTRFPLPLGTLYSPNLTPDLDTGIGRHRDRDIFRLMRHSIKLDGTTTISALMPFQRMADDDLIAAVSYLRALAPQHNVVPAPRYNFLGKVVRTFAPLFKPVLDQTAPEHAPLEAPTVERGAYLARSVANCVGCHTEVDLSTGRFVGAEFAGGTVFEPMPPEYPGSDGKTSFRSPNLTRDASGVLKNFPTKEEWIGRFRLGRVLPGSPMHWGAFKRMSDADLEALWLFLRSLPPIAHDVGSTAFRAAG